MNNTEKIRINRGLVEFMVLMLAMNSMNNNHEFSNVVVYALGSYKMLTTYCKY